MQQRAEKNDKINDSTTEELSSAAATGNLHLVKKLLKTGVKVNDKNKFGRTPLQVSFFFFQTV